MGHALPISWMVPLGLLTPPYRAEPLAKSRNVENAAETVRLHRAMHDHGVQIWRILRRAGLSDRDADEALQDVFMVLARRLADVPVQAERSFLISTALRTASDRRKSSARHAHQPLVHDPPSTLASSEELLQQRQMRQWLDQALDQLSEEQRAVFVLVEFDELTGPEAAEVLGLPLGTIASRLRVARQTFDKAVRSMHQRQAAKETT